MNDNTFLDIGANLGSYALPVAQADRHVVAVEPNWNVLRRLSKSVYLGRVSNNIDQLHYAISEKRSKTFTTENWNQNLNEAISITWYRNLNKTWNFSYNGQMSKMKLVALGAYHIWFKIRLGLFFLFHWLFSRFLIGLDQFLFGLRLFSLSYFFYFTLDCVVYWIYAVF